MLTHLFFDVGGVILTNGWDRYCRAAAARHFGYDHAETEKRHYTVADALEKGLLSLDGYLDQVFFFQPRSFSRETFLDFMKSRSRPHQANIELLLRLKQEGRFVLCTLNNESFEINQYRIEQYGLRRCFHYFFSSCFLTAAKPESIMFQKALWITQQPPENCLFIDDRPNNAAAAAEVGMQAIHLERPLDLEGVLRERGVLK